MGIMNHKARAVRDHDRMFLASRKCMKWQLKMHTYTCQIPWLTLRD